MRAAEAIKKVGDSEVFVVNLNYFTLHFLRKSKFTSTYALTLVQCLFNKIYYYVLSEYFTKNKYKSLNIVNKPLFTFSCLKFNLKSDSKCNKYF